MDVSSPSEKLSIKIGFCMEDASSERWSQDTTFFCNEVRRLGGIPITKITPSSNPRMQLALARELVDEGCSVIVVVAAESKSAAGIVNYAHSKGVKVIAYDRLIMYSVPDFYVSFDNVRVGKMQAEYLKKHVPEGDYVILGGPTTDQNASMFKEGQMEALKHEVDAGKIKIIHNTHLNSWSADEAEVYFENLLKTLIKTPDAVLATNDAIAEGVIRVLKRKGLVGKIMVTGQDGGVNARKLIVNGSQAMTVYKPISKLASRTAKLAIDIAENRSQYEKVDFIHNGETKIPYIKIEPVVVDKSNMQRLGSYYNW